MMKQEEGNHNHIRRSPMFYNPSITTRVLPLKGTKRKEFRRQTQVFPTDFTVFKSWKGPIVETDRVLQAESNDALGSQFRPITEQ